MANCYNFTSSHVQVPRKEVLFFSAAFILTLIISLIRLTLVMSSPIYQSLRPGTLTVMVDLSLGNRNGLLLPDLSAFTRSQAVVVG